MSREEYAASANELPEASRPAETARTWTHLGVSLEDGDSGDHVD